MVIEIAKSNLLDSEGRVHHLRLREKDVGRFALLPGDPGRVPLIAKHFHDGKLITSNREYTTYGGYVGKEYVISTSTGIGGPATAIAVEELARLGVKVMIRIGTCGGLQPYAKGVVIADAAVRLDGTTPMYVMAGYPAAATPEVVLSLKQAARSLGVDALCGITASTDSFYVGEGRYGYRGYFPSHEETLMDDLQMANVLCIEMESSTLFTLGRLFSLMTGSVLAVGIDRTTNQRTKESVDDAIKVAIEGVRRLAKSMD